MVTALTVREGDRVERDQTLAELDTEFLQARRATIVAQMQEAKARREGAELSLRRAQELFDAALIAAEDLDKAEVELNALDARVVSLEASMAEIDLGIEGSVIRAPFDGAVSEKLTEVGGWIRTGDPVLELVSADDLEVSAEVPEIHFSKLRVGQKAQVRLEALPGKTLTGQVQATAPEADPQARTFAVKVAVQSNGGLVRPGMVATVKFAPSAPRTVTLVPKDALVERAEGWVVFAADANNEAVLRQVRLGDSVGEWTEVVGRVRPGDQVVILGNERLRDGEKLAPRTRELPAP